VDKPDFICNIAIYDIEGRLVKKLIFNELLASKGQIKWEGETDEKLKAPTGTYIIYIELISPQGEVKRLKKVCVLTDSF
jgi:flagellar hook assembly protein FlgD